MVSSGETPPQKVQRAAAPVVQWDPSPGSGSEDSSWKTAAIVLSACGDLQWNQGAWFILGSWTLWTPLHSVTANCGLPTQCQPHRQTWEGSDILRPHPYSMCNPIHIPVLSHLSWHNSGIRGKCQVKAPAWQQMPLSGPWNHTLVRVCERDIW